MKLLLCYCYFFLLRIINNSVVIDGKVYNVGPTRTYKSIGAALDAAMPLKPGDQILIDAKSTPYYEKFVINDKGTVAKPIIIRGIPDSQGRLPIIDGQNAITSRKLDYWNEDRSVIKIGGATYPRNDRAANIVIDRLHVRNGREGYTFTDDKGNIGYYIENVACIHIESGTDITIKRSNLSNCGNGLFVTSFSKSVLIESNLIYANGYYNSAYEHNVYSECDGITYRYNFLGRLIDGALGSNIKDRSAGLVVAYNFIHGGNRQLDLVQSNDPAIYNRPSYRTTYVYGNIMIDTEGPDNRQFINYGGEGDDYSIYRKGTLAVYHNTMISTRDGRSTFVRLVTNDETCIARNNIIYVTSTNVGDQLELLAENRGTLLMSNNFLKNGYVNSFVLCDIGKIVNDNPILSDGLTTNPGIFLDPNFATTLNVRLSKSLGPVAPLDKTWPKVQMQYSYDAGWVWHESRTTTTDIGAFQFNNCNAKGSLCSSTTASRCCSRRCVRSRCT